MLFCRSEPTFSAAVNHTYPCHLKGATLRASLPAPLLALAIAERSSMEELRALLQASESLHQGAAPEGLATSTARAVGALKNKSLTVTDGREIMGVVAELWVSDATCGSPVLCSPCSLAVRSTKTRVSTPA
jgi:hypothetical protein